MRRWPLPAIVVVLLLSAPVAAARGGLDRDVEPPGPVDIASWPPREWVRQQHARRRGVRDRWLGELADRCGAAAGGSRPSGRTSPTSAIRPDERIADVVAIYCGGDAERSADLMRRYGATYVIDGGRPEPCDRAGRLRDIDVVRARLRRRRRASGASRPGGRSPLELADAGCAPARSSPSSTSRSATAGRDAPPAVTDLTLIVPAGEICVLVGPSGCGKTTTHEDGQPAHRADERPDHDRRARTS